MPQPVARHLIVSDVDDTIIRSAATSAVRLVMETLRHNVYRRVAFPGVAAFYRALADTPELDPDPRTGHVDARPHGQTPIYYLTSSVWRVHGLLTAFFALHGLPAGPLLMSDRRLVGGGLDPHRHRHHKLGHLRALLELHPHHRLVLIGDCGQRDPEIFAELTTEAPARVAAIYLRDLGDAARRAHVDALLAPAQKQGIALCIAPDSLTHARHAAHHGLIDPARLDGIERTLPVEALPELPATQEEIHDERPAGFRILTAVIEPAEPVALVRGAAGGVADPRRYRDRLRTAPCPRPRVLRALGLIGLAHRFDAPLASRACPIHSAPTGQRRTAGDTMKRLATCLIALGLAATGCGKKDDTPPSAAPATADKAAPATPTAPASAATPWDGYDSTPSLPASKAPGRSAPTPAAAPPTPGSSPATRSPSPAPTAPPPSASSSCPCPASSASRPAT
ncbi:MAG: phosphatase domain-containing protein [bacterium]